MAEENVDDRPGWEEACRREAAIRDLINRYPKRLTVTAVDEVAWEARAQPGDLVSAH
jgi:putative transposase